MGDTSVVVTELRLNYALCVRLILFVLDFLSAHNYCLLRAFQNTLRFQAGVGARFKNEVA
eukprot:scaffold257909_cov66-Attheya_sp.AAC.4